MWLPGSYSGTWFCQAPWNGPANPTAWPRRKRQQTPVVSHNLCVCLCLWDRESEKESLCLYSVIDDAWVCVSIFVLWSNFWSCFVALWFLTLTVALQSGRSEKHLQYMVALLCVCVSVCLFTCLDSLCVLWADCDTHASFWSNAHGKCCKWSQSAIALNMFCWFWQFPLQAKHAQPLCSISKFFHCVMTFTLAIRSVFVGTSKRWGSTLAYWEHSVMLLFWLWPGTEDYRSKLGGDCFADLACPEKCRCEGTTVDCSNQKLTKIPDHIPQYTAELWVTLDLPTTKWTCVCVVLKNILFSLFVSDHLFSFLFSGVWTTMNSLCLRLPGSSKSCLNWERCESDML